MWRLWTLMVELLSHMLKMGDIKMSMIYLSIMVVQTWFLFQHLLFPVDEVVYPRNLQKFLTNCLPALYSETFSAVIAASIIFIFSSRVELDIWLKLCRYCKISDNNIQHLVKEGNIPLQRKNMKIYSQYYIQKICSFIY